MNITFVNESIGYGGAAKMMMVVARGLKEKGHNVSVINLNTHNIGVFQETEGINVVTAHCPEGKGILYNYRYAKFTVKAAKQLNTDVIVGFKFLSNFCAVVAGKMLRIPSIISERGDPNVEFRTIKFPTNLKLWIVNHADAGAFQTKEASEFYSKHLQQNCAIIPNPIMINRPIPFVNYENLPKTIVSLGRIDNSQKRIDVMIEAFSLFYQKHPEYRFVIYGIGGSEDLLHSLIKKYKLDNAVDVKGLSTDSLSDLSHEGMFVITSDFEGISNSLLEAMAVGLPVVSTDHSPGGARLLITDHENGLLVPVRNPEAIANAMSEYAENPELAKRCGSDAKNVVTRFSVEKAINDWDQLIHSVYQKCNKK